MSFRRLVIERLHSPFLRESGLGVTYLRPSGFASNAFAWRDAIRAGNVTDPTGDGVLAVMDPEDIATR